MNEDAQCVPDHDQCPEGYHSHEDDETGLCIAMLLDYIHVKMDHKSATRKIVSQHQSDSQRHH